MSHPQGPLLQTLAKRILANLNAIEQLAPRHGTPQQDEPPYSDTQLLISLLGVLVFPHERAPDALGELLLSHQDLSQAVEVRYRESKADNLFEDNGELIDPASIKDLPRLLRNSIAHFNVRSIDLDGRFGGIRIWNEAENGRITVVADIYFDNLRKIAKKILQALAAGEGANLDDPPDPLETLQRQDEDAPKRRAPRISDDIWAKFLLIHDDNAELAHEAMNRALVATIKSYRER